MAENIELSPLAEQAKATGDSLRAVLPLRKRERCPARLEWFRPVVQHQRTNAYRDDLAYRIAVARQQAAEIIALRNRTP